MHNLSDINQTFIIESLVTSGSSYSACTALYSNAISSCSGDTTIFLNNGTIVFDGNIYTNDNITANTINASAIYSGGTNILNLLNAKSLTGGSYNNVTDTLTLNNSDNSIINVTGFTNYYTTGATLIG